MTFFRYIKHGFGFRKAFYFTFDITVRDALLGAATYILLLVVLAALIGFVAGSVIEQQDKQLAHRAAYVEGLEKVVASCLSDATGKPVKIDGKTYLCGIVPVGI